MDEQIMKLILDMGPRGLWAIILWKGLDVVQFIIFVVFIGYWVKFFVKRCDKKGD